MSAGQLVRFEKLDAVVQQLLREGARAREFSYSPYSNFKVGSALLCEDGKLFTGCNVENASYSPTVCAERCALSKAVSEGRRKFRSVSVVADKIGGQLTTPCGVCRQSLYEFGNINVYVSSPNLNEVLVTTTYDLLPFGFGNHNDSNNK